MSVDHNFVFLSCEVPELETPVDACLTVFGSGGLKEVKPVVDELFCVLAGRAEVDELDLACVGVPEEVSPVGVGLHNAEYEELAQAEVDYTCRNLDRPSG